MRAVDIIARKRDGEKLTAEEIQFFCSGSVDGRIKDYQAAAFLMAVFLKGMDAEETAALTMAMAQSGDQIDLGPIEGVTVDKHSTGGVGDTTTLILAPTVAACGARIAKMSGRGLGHTGGTLDKLESIPGLTTHLTRDQFIAQVNRIGLAVISQTPTLVPADKLFYTLRDVTATIGSIPLIASSVMSKKIASGAQAILLDVKVGQGAFMKTYGEAQQLAHAMVDIGRRVGRKVAAVITDMEAPLGDCVGNALDVREAVEILRGERKDSPLREVTVQLCGHLLHLAGLTTSVKVGRANAEEAIRNGQALERLADMIEAQGGNRHIVDDLGRLPTASSVVPFKAPQDGWITRLDALCVGDAAMHLGAGRLRKEDAIDPAVGVVLLKRRGAHVKKDEPLAELHGEDHVHIDHAMALLAQAYAFGDAPPTEVPLIREVIA